MGISSEEIPDYDIWGTCAMVNGTAFNQYKAFSYFMFENPDEYPKAYTSDIGR